MMIRYSLSRIKIGMLKSIVGWLALVQALTGNAYAEDLTVARYVDLTLARLHATIESFRDHGHVTSKEDDDLVYAQYGTTAQDYYQFMGKHKDEVAEFLGSHAKQKNEIDRLSAEADRYAALVEARGISERGIASN